MEKKYTITESKLRELILFLRGQDSYTYNDIMVYTEDNSLYVEFDGECMQFIEQE